MLRRSLSSRLALVAVAGILLLVLAVVANQPRPGMGSASSASPTASSPSSPTQSGPAPNFTPTASEGAAAASASGAEASDVPSASSAPAGWLTLYQLLAQLPVAAEQRTGYDRALFPHWIDADGDGCNTRQEVLIAEAVVAPAVGVGCSLSGGTWRSLYDGLVVSDPSALDIDHVVALAEAWDSGAHAWSTDRRELFANDLDVPWALVAASASANRTKSDKDPADWVPSDPSDVCSFVSAWIAVKARWALSVDQREEAALTALIAGCPGARMPLVPSPAGAPAPISTSGAACSPAYPSVCIPPPPPDLNCADIAFRRFTVLPPDPHRFDGDGDGIGCEGG